MLAAMQTKQHTRGVPQGTPPHLPRPDALDLLEQFGTTVTVQRTHEIYGQGEPTKFCWRVLSGCARTVKYLEDGRRYIGDFVWPGDLLGMDDLDLHDFGAESVTNMTLRRYPRRMVEALAQSNAALALRLRTLAAVNLRHAYQQMTLLARTSATERIAAFILDMHRRSTATDRRILYVPMSRTDIADYLGLSIETVCRSLAKLRRDGIVEPSQSGFELRNRPAMLELVHEFTVLSEHSPCHGVFVTLLCLRSCH